MNDPETLKDKFLCYFVAIPIIFAMASYGWLLGYIESLHHRYLVWKYKNYIP